MHMCMGVCVCRQNRLLHVLHSSPHRLVRSFPIRPVEQDHLFIKLLHSYNQYVGVGSVCVLYVCISVGSVDRCVCVCVITKES